MAVRNFVLIGAPGSGKSTQAELLRQKYGLAHIDVGSELRAAAEEDSAFGRQINEIINHRREFVPDAVVYSVLVNALKQIPEEQGILLDGAPRRESQIDEVRALFEAFRRTIDQAIVIGLSEEESVNRISKRLLCFGCHRPYILGKDIGALPAACPSCGGKVGQRQDDTPQGVHKRFQVFRTETQPVVDFFRSKGNLIEVDGSKPAQGVFEELIARLSST